MKKLDKIYGLRMPMVRRWLADRFRIRGNAWYQSHVLNISEDECIRLRNIFGDYLGISNEFLWVDVHSAIEVPPHEDRASYWYAKSYFYIIKAPCGSYIENEKGKKLFLEANCLYEFNQFVEHWVCNNGSVIELLTISHMKESVL